MARFDLSDAEWAVIEPLLPSHGRGPRRTDGRKVLNGLFYRLRTGAPWCDLPERYEPYTTATTDAGQRGISKGIFDVLAEECEDSLVFIDGSIVKAHRAASGSKRGAGRRYWTLTRWSHVTSSPGRRLAGPPFAHRNLWWASA